MAIIGSVCLVFFPGLNEFLWPHNCVVSLWDSFYRPALVALIGFTIAAVLVDRVLGFVSNLGRYTLPVKVLFLGALGFFGLAFLWTYWFPPFAGIDAAQMKVRYVDRLWSGLLFSYLLLVTAALYYLPIKKRYFAVRPMTAGHKLVSVVLAFIWSVVVIRALGLLFRDDFSQIYYYAFEYSPCGG